MSRVLGQHEEFTLYCAVAIGHSERNVDLMLWELAQRVTGWGRIQIVERLASTHDERIKAWLRRDGCRNDVMDEYTALICANTGDLLSALQSPSSDDALMKGAGAILTALIRGGPVEDITAYRDGAEATSLYLHRLASREVVLEDVNVVAAIQRYVASLRDCPDAAPPGWDERLAGIESQIEAILSRSG